MPSERPAADIVGGAGNDAASIASANASLSMQAVIASVDESQIALLAMTEDAKEGLKAFGEKRKPSWPGK